MSESKIPNPLYEINDEYLNILRKELKWIYRKLNNSEMEKFEDTLVELNSTFISMLSMVLIKKRISFEEQSLNEMMDLFKVSMN